MERLKEILNTMDISEVRKDLNASNLRWLIRNIGIKNNNHPDLKECIKLIKKEL